MRDRPSFPLSFFFSPPPFCFHSPWPNQIAIRTPHPQFERQVPSSSFSLPPFLSLHSCFFPMRGTRSKSSVSSSLFFFPPPPFSLQPRIECEGCISSFGIPLFPPPPLLFSFLFPIEHRTRTPLFFSLIFPFQIPLFS